MESLPYEMNKLLFDLNVAHNSNFDITKEIQYKNLSTVLVGSLCERFDVKLNAPNIADTQIIIEENLKHDLYQFDINPFLKLKTTSPILFESFVFFIRNTPFSIIDEGNTELLNDFTIECLKEMASDKIPSTEKKEYRKAIKEYTSNMSFLKGLKSNKDREVVLKELNDYKPKKEVFKLIKEVLLSWLVLDFSFCYAYPFQYYSDLKFKTHIDGEEDEEEPYENETYDFFDYINFIYTKNETLHNEINSRFEDIYSNFQITNPCWLINLDEEQSHIQKSVRAFETFADEYFEISKLLKIAL